MIKKSILLIVIFCFISLQPIPAEEKPAYTVVPFKGADEALSMELAEMLMADLGKSGEIRLVDRLHFDNILDELAKMELALIKEEDIIEFGIAEGADKIISGSYTVSGEKISLQVWVSDTKTSAVELSDSIEGNKKDIFYFVHQLANRIHYKIAGLWIPEDILAMTSPSPGPTPAPELTPLPTETPQYVNPRPEETDPSLYITQEEEIRNNIIDISVDRGEFSTYSRGDSMVISYRASEDCYITLYSIEADGKVRLVFPNKFHKDNFIKAGELYTIPSEQDFWEYIMGGTPGLESLIAIGSEKPLEIEFQDRELADLEFMPEVNSSPNEFIVESIVPRLNIDKDNRCTVKILKYYLAD